MTPYDVEAAWECFARKNAYTTGPVEVNHQLEESQNISLIDVRESDDFKEGHLPGALNLPKSQWQSLGCLRRDMVNIIYCYSQTCHLGTQAAQFFAGEGFQVMEMEGGFESWKQNKLPIEK